MKKVYSFKKFFSRGIVAIFALALLTTVWSCRDKEEDEHENVTVQFKVQGNGYDKIKAVVTQIGTNQNTVFNINGTSWESPKQVVNTSVGQLHLTATAEGTSTSTLDVIIIVNDKERAKQTSTGANMNATTSVQLYQQYK